MGNRSVSINHSRPIRPTFVLSYQRVLSVEAPVPSPRQFRYFQFISTINDVFCRTHLITIYGPECPMCFINSMKYKFVSLAIRLSVHPLINFRTKLKGQKLLITDFDFHE